MVEMRKRRPLPPTSQANDDSRCPSLLATYLSLEVDETMHPHRLARHWNWTKPMWDRRKQGKNLMKRIQARLLLIAAIWYAVIQFFSLQWILFGRRQNLRRQSPVQLVLLLQSNYDKTGIFLTKQPCDPDYGGIHFQSINESNFGRSIALNDEANFNVLRGSLLDRMDGDMHSDYYHNDELEDDTSHCRRNNWQQKVFRNCNDFHTISMDRSVDGVNDSYEPTPNIKYLGQGYFRAAWLLQSPVTGSTVLKQIRLHEDFDFSVKDFYTIHRDAIVMERLSASPRTVHIYGHCGTSILSEAMAGEIATEMMYKEGWMKPKDLNDQDGVRPLNNYTVDQKLQVALEMAESIADLHGYKEGVIVHGDVHPVQWLRAPDGTIRLNDFNNAAIFDWNGTDYCKPWRWYGGMYRAPEEFRGDYTDDKMDVFSMGNNMYVLLTGLLPYYYLNSEEEAQSQVINGTRPYLDGRYRTRSYGESKMIELMEQCWEYNPDNRPDIFQVVRFLRQAVQDNKKHDQTKQL